MDTNPILDTLKSYASKLFGDEDTTGTDDVGPTVGTKSGVPDLVTLPYTEELISELWREIEASDARIKNLETGWDVLLKAYTPIVTSSGSPETVKVNTHFRNLHSKIGQLFYSSPDLICTAKEPSPAQNVLQTQQPPMPLPGAPPTPPMTMEDLIAVKQAVLASKLGRDGINISRLIDELLFDVLGWAGIGCAKIGYRCTMKMIQQPRMGPAPTPPVPGSVLGLSQPPPTPQLVPQMDPTTGQPLMDTVPVPIYEDYYGRRFSPKKLVMNASLKSTRFDEDAVLMGMHFYLTPQDAKKSFNLSEDEVSKSQEDTRVYQHESDKIGSGLPGMIHGVELWVKASHYSDDQPHPLAINQVVLIEGIKDRPIIWRPSPDQSFDTQGRLTDDSMVGFPIRVLTIRDFADSPFPPSDAAFTNSHIKQLSTFRRQGVKLRDAAIGKYVYDQGAFNEEEIKKLSEGEVGEYVGVESGVLGQRGVKGILDTTAQVHMGPSDAYTEGAIKQEIDETLGISANAGGAEFDTSRTATEVHTISNAVAARNEKERGRVVDFYLGMARMLDQLLMRYADANEYIHIVGETGNQVQKVWSGQIVSGKFFYDIAPDSQARVDTAADFNQLLQYYSLTAKDPLSNRPYVLKKMARMKGLDPAKAVLPPAPPPPPKPDLPSISFAFTAADLGNPLVVEILQKTGMLTPAVPPVGAPPAGMPPPPPHPMPLPPHGGHLDMAEPISQHLMSNSGRRPSEPGAGNHRQEQIK